MKSKAPVVILIAIILMGVLLWTLSALRNSGGVDPERAKLLAEEAEKECVLMGHLPEECPKKVGRHHRECLDEVEARTDEPRLDEDEYLGCMKEAFGEPEGPAGVAGLDGRDAGDERLDTGARESDADATTPDVAGKEEE